MQPAGRRHPDGSGGAEALQETGPGNLTPASLEPVLRRHFVDWYCSPENTRAPGITCMNACAALEAGRPWLQATAPGSKGCGANMRVAPVALFARRHGLSEATRAALAQFQAAMTHGHPTALAASDLTAATVALLAGGTRPAEVPARLRAYAESQREVYHAEWLGALWQRPGVSSPAEFIARGWEECLGALDRLDGALRRPDPAADPCLATGEGWVAEEALATGLLCFLLFPDDPLAALRRAACSSGDSDSTASFTGAFAGAYHGIAAWPADWVERTEYGARLGALAAAWEGAQVAGDRRAVLPSEHPPKSLKSASAGFAPASRRRPCRIPAPPS